MANENDVDININVNSDDALKEIKSFGSSAEKALDNVTSSVGNIGSSLKGAFKEGSSVFSGIATAFGPLTAIVTGAIVGFNKISAAIDDAVAEAKSLKEIGASLSATGEGGSIAVQAISDFADELKATTKVDDDLIKSLFVTAKSFGINTEQAKNLTEAALNLSAATGIDVETAVRQLGGTLDGTAGKINNLGADFRNLSTEQLKSGAAIDLVSKKYAGAAANDVDQYSKATARLSNAFSDLSKGFGRVIIESDLVIGALNLTAKVFEANAHGIGEYKNQLRDASAKQLIDQTELLGNKSTETDGKVKNLIATLEASSNATLINPGDTFGERINQISAQAVTSVVLTGKAAEESRKKFDELLKAIKDAGLTELEVAANVRDERLKILDQSVKDGVVKEEEGVKARIKINDEYGKAVKKQLDEIDKLYEEFANTVEKEGQRAGEALQKVNDLEKSGVLDTKKALELRSKIIGGFNEKRVKEADDAAKKVEDAEEKHARLAKEKIQGLASDPITFILKPDFQASADNLTAIFAGALNSALSGRQGSVKFLSGIAGGLADRILPGIGGVVASIFEKLAAGKEQAKAFVKEFIDSMPEIMSAVVEALPAVFDALAETLGKPKFWESAAKVYAKIVVAAFSGYFFTNVAQAIYDAHVKAFERIGPAFAASFSNITLSALGEGFANFFNGIGPALENAFTNIYQGIGNAVLSAFQPLIDGFNGLKDAFQPMIDAVNSAADAIKSAVSGGPVGGALGNAGGSIGGFASGAATKLDPTGATGQLGDAISNGFGLSSTDMQTPTSGQPQVLQAAQSPSQDTAILAAILVALQQPTVVNTQVKVNQQAFADILLQLNRQNARVSA